MMNLASNYTYLDRTIDQWREAGRIKLDEQIRRTIRQMAYYDGEPVGLSLEGSQREVFRRLLRESRANWCELIVNAVAERLAVVGFSFDDAVTDDLAWTMWQANQMDSDSETVQTDALICGSTYVSVWPSDDNPSGVDIFPEHPLEVTTFYVSPNRREAVAAYKAFDDEMNPGKRIEVLVLPDLVVTWRDPGVEEEPNELGTVPYEQITPSPRTIGPGRSELHSAFPFQDRVNTTVYNRLVASDFGAFRQVTATGVNLTRNEDGSYNAPFDVGADRLLVSENEGASFGVIAESTLSGYLSAESLDVQHLAAITQTPPHYLLGQMTNMSAAGIKAAETGLVAKVRRRAAHIGEGWERVMRRGLSYVGNAGAVDVSSEVIWKDFETRSEGETVDALLKMRALGIPLDVLWQRWGASPQDIEKWKKMAEEEGAMNAIFAAKALGAVDPYADLMTPPGTATKPPPPPAPVTEDAEPEPAT